jgi:hypothetical protein
LDVNLDPCSITPNLYDSQARIPTSPPLTPYIYSYSSTAQLGPVSQVHYAPACTAVPPYYVLLENHLRSRLCSNTLRRFYSTTLSTRSLQYDNCTFSQFCSWVAPPHALGTACRHRAIRNSLSAPSLLSILSSTLLPAYPSSIHACSVGMRPLSHLLLGERAHSTQACCYQHVCLLSPPTVQSALPPRTPTFSAKFHSSAAQWRETSPLAG